MKLARNLLLSGKTLASRKGRTALTLLGMAIGVAAVIVMVAVGSGARREVLERIGAMGTNMLVVSAGKMKTMVGRSIETNLHTTLTLRDWQALRDECPSVTLAAPAQDRMLKIKVNELATRAQVIGSTPEFFSIRDYRLEKGRFFTHGENQAFSRVAVIGGIVRTNLFKNVNPVGKTMRIGVVPFEVIGTLQEKGVNPDGSSQDNSILIPIRTALRRVFNLNYIHLVYIQVKSSRLMTKAEQEITGRLRERHRLNRRGLADDFSIQNQTNVLAAARQTGNSFTLLITGLALISLLVGAVGIMAVMLLTVRERTGEIGLRMAVGSRPRDILLQFLSESLLLGLAGGLGGVLLGLLAAQAVSWGTAWKTEISPLPAALALAFSLMVGLLAGIIPAQRAAAIEPIEALRAK